jgi:hypothetical protein
VNGDRRADAEIRLIPNETAWIQQGSDRLGALVGELAEVGADFGATVILVSADRTRPGEQRGGASPAELIDVVLTAVVGAALDRLVDACFALVSDWVARRRRASRRWNQGEPTFVRILGPRGEVLREVEINEGSEPPDFGQ